MARSTRTRWLKAVALVVALASLWINNESLELRGILDKRAGIDNGKINVNR